MVYGKCVGYNCLLLLLAILGSCQRKRLWTYEFIDIKGYSSNETKLKPNMYVERVGRHQIGVSGTVDWQYDVDETTMSPTGSTRDFRRLPFLIPKQEFIYMKSYYDDIAMADGINCTNLPHFKGNILLPWPRNLYIFDMCHADNGNFPDILAEGLYKFIFAYSGEVVWNVTFFVDIKTKLI